MIKPEQQPKQEMTSTPPVAEKPDVIPPQYKGMPSEVVEELWQNPVYNDAEKNKLETERRQRAIEAIKKGEESREMGKKKQLTERYAGLPNDQKNEFPNAQKEAARVLTEHTQGQRDIDNLSPEESFVLGKLKTAYEEFKKENPDKPFSFDFAKNIDKSVYNNLAQRLSFNVLECWRKTKDQENANAIRKELGIPEQEIKTDGGQKTEDLADITNAYKKVYFEKRNTLRDDLFLVAHGVDPETNIPFELVPGEIGSKFDAHGIAKSDQLEKLLQLLTKGIDDSKPFYTAPFEIPNDVKALMGPALGTGGGTAYKDGLAVVTSGYNEELIKSSIKYVFINDVYKKLVEPLSKKFPQYNFHLLSEQKQVMEDEYLKNSSK